MKNKKKCVSCRAFHPTNQFGNTSDTADGKKSKCTHCEKCLSRDQSKVGFTHGIYYPLSRHCIRTLESMEQGLKGRPVTETMAFLTNVSTKEEFVAVMSDDMIFSFKIFRCSHKQPILIEEKIVAGFLCGGHDLQEIFKVIEGVLTNRELRIHKNRFKVYENVETCYL